MNSFSRELLVNAGAGIGTGQDWNGGRGLFSVLATFGGGTVALEYLGPDGVTWFPAPKVSDGTAISATVAGGILFELPPGKVRANATAATAVYARVDRIPY